MPKQVCTVAAASVEQEESLFSAVRDAAASGARTLEMRLDDGTTVSLLKIFPDEKLVEPCYCEGRTVVVQIPQLGKQTITRFGGVLIPWEDLRAMYVRFKEGGREIELKG